MLYKNKSQSYPSQFDSNIQVDEHIVAVTPLRDTSSENSMQTKIYFEVGEIRKNNSIKKNIFTFDLVVEDKNKKETNHKQQSCLIRMSYNGYYDFETILTSYLPNKIFKRFDDFENVKDDNKKEMFNKENKNNFQMLSKQLMECFSNNIIYSISKKYYENNFFTQFLKKLQIIKESFQTFNKTNDNKYDLAALYNIISTIKDHMLILAQFIFDLRKLIQKENFTIDDFNKLYKVVINKKETLKKLNKYEVKYYYEKFLKRFYKNNLLKKEYMSYFTKFEEINRCLKEIIQYKRKNKPIKIKKSDGIRTKNGIIRKQIFEDKIFGHVIENKVAQNKIYKKIIFINKHKTDEANCFTFVLDILNKCGIRVPRDSYMTGKIYNPAAFLPKKNLFNIFKSKRRFITNIRQYFIELYSKYTASKNFKFSVQGQDEYRYIVKFINNKINKQANFKLIFKFVFNFKDVDDFKKEFNEICSLTQSNYLQKYIAIYDLCNKYIKRVSKQKKIYEIFQNIKFEMIQFCDEDILLNLVKNELRSLKDNQEEYSENNDLQVKKLKKDFVKELNSRKNRSSKECANLHALAVRVSRVKNHESMVANINKHIASFCKERSRILSWIGSLFSKSKRTKLKNRKQLLKKIQRDLFYVFNNNRINPEKKYSYDLQNLKACKIISDVLVNCFNYDYSQNEQTYNSKFRAMLYELKYEVIRNSSNKIFLRIVLIELNYLQKILKVLLQCRVIDKEKKAYIEKIIESFKNHASNSVYYEQKVEEIIKILNINPFNNSNMFKNLLFCRSKLWQMNNNRISYEKITKKLSSDCLKTKSTIKSMPSQDFIDEGDKKKVDNTNNLTTIEVEKEREAKIYFNSADFSIKQKQYLQLLFTQHDNEIKFKHGKKYRIKTKDEYITLVLSHSILKNTKSKNYFVLSSEEKNLGDKHRLVLYKTFSKEKYKKMSESKAKKESQFFFKRVVKPILYIIKQCPSQTLTIKKENNLLIKIHENSIYDKTRGYIIKDAEKEQNTYRKFDCSFKQDTLIIQKKQKFQKVYITIPDYGRKNLSDFEGKDDLNLIHSLEIFLQCLHETHRFHKRGYAHLDIKLKNFAVRKTSDVFQQNTIKLIDYADILEYDNDDMRGHGTCFYASPEMRARIFKNEKNKISDLRTSDIYSLAILLCKLIGLKNIHLLSEEVMTNKVVIQNEEKNTKITQDFLDNSFWTNAKTNYPKISEELDNLRNFILQMISLNPKERPQINECKTRFIDILKQIKLKSNSQTQKTPANNDSFRTRPDFFIAK